MKENTELLARDLAALDLRETHEAAMLQALVDQHDARAIKTECLAFSPVPTEEDEQIAIQKVRIHALAYEYREAIKPGPQIDVLREDKNTMTRSKHEAHRESSR